MLMHHPLWIEEVSDNALFDVWRVCIVCWIYTIVTILRLMLLVEWLRWRLIHFVCKCIPVNELGVLTFYLFLNCVTDSLTLSSNARKRHCSLE